MRNLLTSVESICQFMFAGNATITLESTKSGSRFTYKIRESDDGKKFWVSLMNGPDNETAFQYLGFYRAGGGYEHGRKSRVTENAPSALAFQWFARQLQANKLHESLRVWHEGRCGACGRKLTVPSSIATGLGPECADKRGVAMVRCEGLGGMGLADTVELEMQRMEAEGDRLQTERDERAKAEARYQMEARPSRRRRAA